MSPSSRRAWIEIPKLSASTSKLPVALLAEGVDRNHLDWSLHWHSVVALLAEGVDRNISRASNPPSAVTSPSSRRAWIEIFCVFLYAPQSRGRPPRGGRG